MKTVKFYTLGCKVNQYDTQSIREQFERAGFKELSNTHPADVYIINTCTVTKKADAESLGFIRRAKKENPKAKIIVTGCLAELDAVRIKEIKGISRIIKNKDKHKILPKGKGGISYFKNHTRAFLKIQDGCDNYCSYCKVPLVRGRSKSRPFKEIIMEAQRLVEHGYREIVLTGICLGSYGKDLSAGVDLVRAIEALEKIDGLLRIRLSSIEANDVTDALIKKMSISNKLCRHLHIPIQSGDDKILKKMNRRYTCESYLLLIKKIKKSVSEVAITTDVLVGFPGETEGNFNNTVKLVRAIVPLKTHIFPFSPRQGTCAAKLENNLTQQIIKRRIMRLKLVSDKLASQYKKKFLGKKMHVLFESKNKENPGYQEGHADNYIKVLVNAGYNLKNELIPIKIKKIGKDCLVGDCS